jgi:hypothetical protein
VSHAGLGWPRANDEAVGGEVTEGLSIMGGLPTLSLPLSSASGLSNLRGLSRGAGSELQVCRPHEAMANPAGFRRADLVIYKSPLRNCPAFNF